jgi:TolB-like protein
MFTDIVGYTALMGEDEQRAFELLKKNRSVQRPIIEKHNGRWLKEIGDGVLASFNSVSEAVYCAKEIQKACENEPDLKLRIGIHEGEVVFEGDDVFGDGVNIASRLEPLAPIGGILVSEAVHKNLLNKKGIESTFIREEQLKNVREPVRIYQVKVEGVEPMVVNAEPSTATPLESPKSTAQRKVVFVVVGVIAILLLSYFLFINQSPDQVIDESQLDITDKSIAVLPFVNMSNDPDQEYFSDGISEELLNALVKVQGLKVVGRTSSWAYKGTLKKDLKTIGKELGVTTILEGSVRKSGNFLRITAQLVNTEDGFHLWSETYDIELIVTEIFAVQDKITAEIVQALRIHLEDSVTSLKFATTVNDDACKRSG